MKEKKAKKIEPVYTHSSEKREGGSQTRQKAYESIATILVPTDSRHRRRPWPRDPWRARRSFSTK